MANLRQASFLTLLLDTACLAMLIPANLPGHEAASSYLQVGSLSRRADDEYPWVAIGDSYSAGPGAGTAFGDEPNECFRNVGAYPPQLNRDFPFPDNAMQFLSCTGAVVEDMIATQIPDVDEDQMVVTLSIGGNDLGFGKILKACVFKPGGPLSDDCDETIETARTYLQNELADTLRKGYDAIWDKVTDDDRRKMFVQLYPNFFQEDTDWCNGQSMGIIPGYKPLLDEELRHKLNRLGDEVRDEIKVTMERYVQDQQDWFQNRMFYLDDFDNDVYPGHRFCEKDVETFDDPNIWFFTIGGDDSPTVTAQDLLDEYDPANCTNDPKYDSDFAFGWYCDSVRYVATLGNNNGDFKTFAPEAVTKAFHPKTAAFTVIKNNHKDAIRRLAWPRPINVDLGILQCKPGRDDGDEEFYTSRDDMVQAMADFCESTAQGGINPGLIEGVYDGHIVSATKSDQATDCPMVDVTSDRFVDMCKSRLSNAIDNCKYSLSFMLDTVSHYANNTLLSHRRPSEAFE